MEPELSNHRKKIYILRERISFRNQLMTAIPSNKFGSELVFLDSSQFLSN